MENEVIKVEQTSVSGRDLGVIENEIKYYWRMGQQTALMCIIEIGRRLCEAKSLIEHGKWGKWIEDNFEFSHSSANSFMKLFEEYGADQLTIFGAVADSQTFANLPYSKALQLLAIPREEREEFAQKVGAQEISSRELKKAIEERKAAQEAAAEAEARARELEQSLAGAEIAKAEAEKKAREADEARAKVEKLEADLKKRKESEAKLKEKLKAAETDPKIPDDVIARLKGEAEAAAKTAQEAEIGKAVSDVQKQLEEAREAQKAAEEAKAQAEATAREAMDKLTDAQKRLKMASPSVTEFKALFEQAQEIVKKMRAKIEVIRAEDAETAARLEAALGAFGGSL